MGPIAHLRRQSLQQRLVADLVLIARARLTDLRAIWRDRLGVEPPALRSREIVRRMLAYRLQAAASGDLPAAAKRKLAAIEARRTQPARRKSHAPVKLGPGATLLREWQGVQHRVVVTVDGFMHADTTYRSLSEVARAITGSRWNGPLFFGLRQSQPAA